MPYFGTAAKSFPTSGSAGSGRVVARAGSPTSAAKRSNRAGEVVWSILAGPASDTRKAWGMSRGRRAKVNAGRKLRGQRRPKTARSGLVGRRHLLGPSLEPVAVALGHHHLGVVHQAVDHGAEAVNLCETG